jgi:dihydroorotase
MGRSTASPPKALSTAPAKVGRLAGGSLAVGSAADLTVIDPELGWTLSPTSLSSRSTNTPFLDRQVKGAVRMTLVDGRPVYER